MKINVTSTITRSTDSVRQRLTELKANPEPVLRMMAMGVLPEMRKRVHVEGKDAAGNRIGSYSTPYMKLRQAKYNRTADDKVVLSLTRQMEQDLTVVELNPGYGIGYLNGDNFRKAMWLEEKYNKEILTALSEDEQQLAEAVAEEYIAELLNNTAE